MMFKGGIGPEEEEAYLRPETCQSIFVDFPRLYKTMRGKLPLGIAQVGKSFRNEIAPRQSLLRLREFYQAEIEVFCNPNNLSEVEKFSEIQDVVLRIQTDGDPIPMTCKEAVESGVVPNKLVAYYLGILTEFYEKTGIDITKSRFRKLGDKEKAFYAEIEFDFEVDNKTEYDFTTFEDAEEIIEEVTPFYIVEDMPQFNGGDMSEFWKYAMKNIRYPEVAAENGVSGTVYMQFTVRTAGYVIDVKVIKGVHPDLDEEAIRVIKNSPKWTPGKQRGRTVPVIMSLPMKFILQ